MAINLKQTIADLKNLLERSRNDLSELQSFLITKCLKEMEDYDAMLLQCNEMRELKYNKLTDKTKKIAADENKRFYIGYTKDMRFYLWTTDPKGAVAMEMIKKGSISKTRTYYTHLAGVNEENEDTLIKQYIGHKRCLNVNHYGEKSTEGIVYVLVYTRNN